MDTHSNDRFAAFLDTAIKRGLREHLSDLLEHVGYKFEGDDAHSCIDDFLNVRWRKYVATASTPKKRRQSAKPKRVSKSVTKGRDRKTSYTNTSTREQATNIRWASIFSGVHVVVKRKPIDVNEQRDRKQKRLERKLRYAVHSLVKSVSIRSTCGVEQSGNITPVDKAAKRAERDRLQRKAVRDRARLEEKKKPKDERKANVLRARDKRNPAVEQSGYEHLGWIGAGVAGVAIGCTLPTLIRKASAMFTRAEEAAEATRDTMMTVRVILEHLHDFGKTLSKYFSGFLWKSVVAMIIWYTLRNNGVVNPVVASAVLTALQCLLGTTVWDHVANFFQGSNEGPSDAKEQSGGYSVAPKLLASLIAFSALRGKAGPSMITEFAKRIAMIERMSGGFETFLAWLLEAVQEIVNYIRQSFGQKRVDFLRSAHKPTYEWMREVDNIWMRHNTAATEIVPEELTKLVKLFERGTALREIYRGTAMYKEVELALIKVNNLLVPNVGAINARNNFRQEPVCIMLRGEPGIGKTLLTMAMAMSILANSGTISLKDGMSADERFNTLAQEIWQKGSSEYWNSYAGQACVIMDDAFQARVKVGQEESQFEQIIRMVSSWSFPLNMADVGSKGKSFFNSKLIIGTTNVSSIDSEARTVLHDPSAVSRRIQFGFEIFLLPQYADARGFLNIALYHEELDKCRRQGTTFPWHMWEVASHDFLTGRTSEIREPLDNVVARAATSLARRASSHVNAKQHLVHMASMLGPTVPAGQPEESTEAKKKRTVSFAEPIAEEFSFLPDDLDEQSGQRPRLNRSCFATLYDQLMSGGKHPHTAETAKFVKDTFYPILVNEDVWNNYLIDWEAIAMQWGAMIVGALIIGTVATAAVLLVRELLKAVWSWLRCLLNGDDNKPVAQSNRPTVPTRKRVEQSMNKGTNEYAVQQNIYANSYKVHFVQNDGLPFVLGQVQFLQGELAVMPNHYLRNIQEAINEKRVSLDTPMVFRNARQDEHVHTETIGSFMKLSKHVIADADLVFVKFTNIRAHRNVVNNYMKEADLKYLGGSAVVLFVCKTFDGDKPLRHVLPFAMYSESCSTGRAVSYGKSSITRHVGYRIATRCGDCGAPLMLVDNSLFSGRTAFGMHVAGFNNGQSGFSTIITQEMIENANTALDVIIDDFESDLAARGIVAQSGNDLPFNVCGSFLPIGVTDRPINLCPKSKLKKVNAVYGCFGEQDAKPAPLSRVLRDGQYVNPMENAVLPYSTETRNYTQEWLPFAVHVATRPLMEHTRDYSRRIYTFEEAVLGVPSEKFRSIPRGTAAGFPYVYDVKSGKREFFGDKEDYDLTLEKCKELEERVTHVLDEAKLGRRLSHVFVDFLKDELRPAEKVEAVKTRLISSAPLDYTIAWRRMFGAFSSAVMRKHTVIGMAPGICAYTDWDVLAQQLSKKGARVCDGDFKAFDASEQPAIHRLILDVVNQWYDDGPENARIREVLWLDMMHSRHIGGTGADQRYIYQWNKSLPSGHPFTTIVNSIYSLVMLVGAYISLTGDLTDFWTYVSAVTYGDDNAVNMSESVSEVYNQMTIARALEKEFGVTYTPGRKDGKWLPYTTLDQITFLKRGFSLENHQWLAPLAKESFLFIAYWTTSERDLVKKINHWLETTLVELSLNSAEMWDEYAPIVAQLYNKFGFTFRAPFNRASYQYLARTCKDFWF